MTFAQRTKPAKPYALPLAAPHTTAVPHLAPSPQGWVDTHPSEPAFVVPQCLKQLVAAGKLGRKSGQGFFMWEADRRQGVARL
jgi:hypothetical protein